MFWDKTSYVFGVAAKKLTDGGKAVIEPEISKKSIEDHAAFVAAHKALLADTDEPELLAFLRFLEAWKPEHWSRTWLSARMRLIGTSRSRSPANACRLDQIAEGARAGPQRHRGAHERATLPRFWRRQAICAASSPVQGLRPGAQSSGAALVSYNADAFVSFDADKAATAPVSEEAAFKYGAALNWLLDRDNARSFRLGETTVVFWADDKSTSGGDDAASDVEEAFRSEMTDGEAPVDSAGADTDSEDDDDE